MPRAADPAVRSRLVERTAELLAAGEAVSLRRVAADAGTTTMSVYTHFGGMPGLMSAVRQEGFARLAARLAQVDETDDAVRDLAAVGSAYVGSGLASPALYLRMFDPSADLADAEAADATFGRFAGAARRARAEGRMRLQVDADAAATQLWVAAHGMLVLVVSGVLPRDAVAQLESLVVTCLVGWGDAPDDAARSVAAGWRV